MSSYVSEELRELVAIRAEGLCEYCLIHEEDTFFKCQVNHIISLKHGGQTKADNLAYACVVCKMGTSFYIGRRTHKTAHQYRQSHGSSSGF